MTDPSNSWLDATRSGQHAVHVFDDGAVLIDLRTGDLFQLNRSAAFIYEQLSRGVPPEGITELLSARFGIHGERAREDILTFMGATPLETRAAPSACPSPFRYVQVGDLFEVRRDNTTLLHIHEEGESVTLGQGTHEMLSAALTWVVPKLLALQGHPVLHASSVAIACRGLAFSGRSGAGKTTLARAFAAAGATLLGEDTFVVRMIPGVAAPGLTPVERPAVRWVSHVLGQDCDPGHQIDCRAILRIENAPIVPLAELMFLDATRRHGEGLRKVTLGKAAGAATILQNLFWGAADPSDYRRGLAWSNAIASAVALSNLTVPLGTNAMSAAVRHYTEKTAS